MIYQAGANDDLSDAGSARSPHRIKHQKFHIGQTTTAPDGSPSRVLVRQTWNTDIVEELAPLTGDSVISKHRFSAFFETELDSVLRAKDVETLIFTGATTSVCVESTVRDAMFRDYRCVVLEDCTAELIAHDAADRNHEASLLAIGVLLGWVTDSKSFLATLPNENSAATG